MEKVAGSILRIPTTEHSTPTWEQHPTPVARSGGVWLQRAHVGRSLGRAGLAHRAASGLSVERRERGTGGVHCTARGAASWAVGGRVGRSAGAASIEGEGRRRTAEVRRATRRGPPSQSIVPGWLRPGLLSALHARPEHQRSRARPHRRRRRRRALPIVAASAATMPSLPRPIVGVF